MLFSILNISSSSSHFFFVCGGREPGCRHCWKETWSPPYQISPQPIQPGAIGRQRFAVGDPAHLLNFLLGRDLAHEMGPHRCTHLMQAWNSKVVCKFIFPYETNGRIPSFNLSLLIIRSTNFCGVPMRSGSLYRALGEIRKTQPHSVGMEKRKTNNQMHLFWHLSSMCWFPAQPLELVPIQGS